MDITTTAAIVALTVSNFLQFVRVLQGDRMLKIMREEQHKCRTPFGNTTVINTGKKPTLSASL